MKIRILKKEIQKGKRFRASECALALAIRRTFGATKEDVTVGPWTAAVGKDVYKLGGSAFKFVSMFDDRDIPKSKMKAQTVQIFKQKKSFKPVDFQKSSQAKKPKKKK